MELPTKEIYSIISDRLPHFKPVGVLERLKGGNLNHVWRLQGQKRSLIIKYAPPHIASNPDILLSTKRIDFEAKALNLFQTRDLLHSIISHQVRPPQRLYYDKEQHILIMEDVGNIPSLDRWLIDNPSYMETGAALGRFIGQLHRLSFLHPNLQKEFHNKDIQKTRQQVQYRPAAEYASKARIEDIELIKTRTETLGELLLEPGYCLVMGDLWPPSVLIDQGNIRIIDWEFVHYGRPLQDIGHFAAHCWMQAHAGSTEEQTLQYPKLWFAFWEEYQRTMDHVFSILFDEKEFRYMAIHIGAEILMRSTGPFQDNYVYSGLPSNHPLIIEAANKARSLITNLKWSELWKKI